MHKQIKKIIRQNSPLIPVLKIYSVNSFSEVIALCNKVITLCPAIIEYNFGLMHEKGNFVDQNMTLAIKYYHKAAGKGHAQAQNRLGTMYYCGQGVKQNFVQAVNLYRKAAMQGNINAQQTLGEMYGKGQGVKQDYNVAFYWYNKIHS